MENTVLWIEKVNLGRILDPLQLGVLRNPEETFFLGITTQTSRLRYYSFLTWAWKNIKEKKLIELDRTKILDLEKILTLASANHHFEKNEPKGLRNVQSSKDFLKSDKEIQLDKFTSFGKHNRVGYGNDYYSASLAKLNILGKRDAEILVSPIADKIEELFRNSLGKSEPVYWKISLKKSELKLIEKSCICTVPKEEQELWKYVFFGLTKPSPTGSDLDLSNLDKIIIPDPDKLNFDFLKLDEDKYVLDDEGVFEEIIGVEEFEKENFASIMRTFSLFLFLEIISQNRFFDKGNNIYHILRDSIYYQQILQPDGSIIKLNIKKLEKFQKYWEVYVHNLYYISVFEKSFHILLEISKMNPLGISMDSILKNIQYSSIIKIINSNGINVNLDNSIDEAIIKVEDYFSNKKSNLNKNLNEHYLIQQIINSKETEESFAYVILLFLLNKYRFKTFEENQLRIIKYKEHRHVSIKPDNVYKKVENFSIKEFIRWLLEFVKDQHRISSAKKLVNSGTRSWLLTEEEGMIFFYGKKYDFRPFPEGKLYVVLELLGDMGLVKLIEEHDSYYWQITEEGKNWLKKLQ